MIRIKRLIKKILKKIIGLFKTPEPKSAAPAKKPSETPAQKNVIWPTVKDTQYNKRIYNYLLEKQLGDAAKRWVIEQMFYRETGRFPNLDNPQGFNEKLQWMRFHYHDPLMTRCVNKLTFKDYIKETVGEQYVVPLYGSWGNVNDIDFDALPDAFALKSNWGWGDLQNILVKDKKFLNIDLARATMAEWLMPWNNYYYQSFEWDSKDIEPCILAEELLQPSCGEIIDYKFYCYNGRCRHFLVCKDRTTKTKYINYDLDFNCIRLSPKSDYTQEPFQATDQFREMLRLAETLAEPFPLVRVDFYDIDGRIYIGELTFSPGGGFNTYYPEWDLKLGSYLELPEANV